MLCGALQNSMRQTVVSSMCPWVTDAARKASGQARACDVSSVLDHMLSELITAENPGDEQAPEEYRELHAAVQAAPELFLGLAAMPLALRKLPDGRLVAAVSGDVFTPTRCIAAKVLRQAAVVALLDTAPCMRHALGAGWAPSAAVEKRDASGARVMCLHVGEVRHYTIMLTNLALANASRHAAAASTLAAMSLGACGVLPRGRLLYACCNAAVAPDVNSQPGQRPHPAESSP